MDCKIYKEIVTYTDKTTNEQKEAWNFFIQVNGFKVSIRPSFKNDFKAMLMIADTIDNK